MGGLGGWLGAFDPHPNVAKKKGIRRRLRKGLPERLRQTDI